MRTKMIRVVSYIKVNGRRFIKIIKYVCILTPALFLTINSTTFASNQEYTGNWKISANYGDIDHVHLKPHKGVDFAITTGTPIKSLVNGRVVSVLDQGNKSWGKSVHIKDNKTGHTIIFGHLSKTKVVVGQKVHAGQVVALSGNSGHSTGPHLHVQVKINGKSIDPTPLINKAERQGLIGK